MKKILLLILFFSNISFSQRVFNISYMEIKLNGESVSCDDCNRLLFIEEGVIKVENLSKFVLIGKAKTVYATDTKFKIVGTYLDSYNRSCIITSEGESKNRIHLKLNIQYNNGYVLILSKEIK